MLKQMVDIISKSFPLEQATREALWIKSELQEDKWISACHEREKQVPLQYILGNQPFGKLDLLCKPNVLIPRLDTEEWVLEACDLLKDHKIDNTVDYCTGSGCVGLTLAVELQSKIYCIDYKNEAVILTKENMERNIDLLQSPVEVLRGDIFDKVLPPLGDFKNPNVNSILFSNPPYIPQEDLVINEVEESVLKYEPVDALLGDLEFYNALSNDILLPNPAFKAFVFELGYLKQASCIRKNLPSTWTVGIRNDSSNHLRNVVGWKTGSKFDVLKNMVHKII